MARTTGLGAASIELLWPTAPAEPPADVPPDDVEPDERDDGGAESQAPPPKAWRKRPAPAGKAKARNLRLTEDVHDRLWLLARQRKQSVSAVANDLLDRALPRWERGTPGIGRGADLARTMSGLSVS